MPRFKYTALSHDGGEVSGVVEGRDEFDAAARVRESCGVILKLSRVREGLSIFDILNTDIGAGHLHRKAFILMCGQFAMILRSGVPIVRAVRLIADKTADRTLRKLLRQIGEDVEEGRSLSAAFEERGSRFLPVPFVETLRAGEASGTPDRSFDTLHRYFSRQMQLQNKVRVAMSYPLFVLLIATGVVAVFLAKVVPAFGDFFSAVGSDLPAATKFLLAASDFLQRHAVPLLAILAALTLLCQLAAHAETGRVLLAKFILRVPLLGNIAELNAAGQFVNSLKALLDSGLPMNRAVSVAAKTLDNAYLAVETGKIAGYLEEGRSLSASMRETGVLPDILIDMTTVGEETGKLTETLDTIALYYDAELETAIQAALSRLGPSLLVVLTSVTGFVVITIYTTMFSLYATI